MYANDKYRVANPILDALKQKDSSKMTGGSNDFNTNIMNDVLVKSPLSKKIFIQAVSQSERAGPVWHSSTIPINKDLSAGQPSANYK